MSRRPAGVPQLNLPSQQPQPHAPHPPPRSKRKTGTGTGSGKSAIPSAIISPTGGGAATSRDVYSTLFARKQSGPQSARGSGGPNSGAGSGHSASTAAVISQLVASVWGADSNPAGAAAAAAAASAGSANTDPVLHPIPVSSGHPTPPGTAAYELLIQSPPLASDDPIALMSSSAAEGKIALPPGASAASAANVQFTRTALSSYSAPLSLIPKPQPPPSTAAPALPPYLSGALTPLEQSSPHELAGLGLAARGIIGAPAFPPIRSTERDEVRQLGEALDYFIRRLDDRRLRDMNFNIDDSGAIATGAASHMDQLLSIVREEETIYDLFFAETIRQVSVTCRERGVLLSRLRNHYRSMFKRIPHHASTLQKQLTAQRALTTQLTRELETLRDTNFAANVQLSALNVSVRDTTVQLDTTREELSAEQHSANAQRTLFAALQRQWETQRVALNAQIDLLREHKNDSDVLLSVAGDALHALPRQTLEQLLSISTGGQSTASAMPPLSREASASITNAAAAAAAAAAAKKPNYSITIREIENVTESHLLSPKHQPPPPAQPEPQPAQPAASTGAATTSVSNSIASSPIGASSLMSLGALSTSAVPASQHPHMRTLQPAGGSTAAITSAPASGSDDSEANSKAAAAAGTGASAAPAAAGTGTGSSSSGAPPSLFRERSYEPSNSAVGVGSNASAILAEQEREYDEHMRQTKQKQKAAAAAAAAAAAEQARHELLSAAAAPHPKSLPASLSVPGPDVTPTATPSSGGGALKLTPSSHNATPSSGSGAPSVTRQLSRPGSASRRTTVPVGVPLNVLTQASGAPFDSRTIHRAIPVEPPTSTVPPQFAAPIARTTSTAGSGGPSPLPSELYAAASGGGGGGGGDTRWQEMTRPSEQQLKAAHQQQKRTLLALMSEELSTVNKKHHHTATAAAAVGAAAPAGAGATAGGSEKYTAAQRIAGDYHSAEQTAARANEASARVSTERIVRARQRLALRRAQWIEEERAAFEKWRLDRPPEPAIAAPAVAAAANKRKSGGDTATADQIAELNRTLALAALSERRASRATLRRDWSAWLQSPLRRKTIAYRVRWLAKRRKLTAAAGTGATPDLFNFVADADGGAGGDEHDSDIEDDEFADPEADASALASLPEYRLDTNHTLFNPLADVPTTDVDLDGEQRRIEHPNAPDDPSSPTPPDSASPSRVSSAATAAAHRAHHAPAASVDRLDSDAVKNDLIAFKRNTERSNAREAAASAAAATPRGSISEQPPSLQRRESINKSKHARTGSQQPRGSITGGSGAAPSTPTEAKRRRDAARTAAGGGGPGPSSRARRSSISAEADSLPPNDGSTDDAGMDDSASTSAELTELQTSPNGGGESALTAATISSASKRTHKHRPSVSGALSGSLRFPKQTLGEESDGTLALADSAANSEAGDDTAMAASAAARRRLLGAGGVGTAREKVLEKLVGSLMKQNETLSNYVYGKYKESVNSVLESNREKAAELKIPIPASVPPPQPLAAGAGAGVSAIRPEDDLYERVNDYMAVNKIRVEAEARQQNERERVLRANGMLRGAVTASGAMTPALHPNDETKSPQIEPATVAAATNTGGVMGTGSMSLPPALAGTTVPTAEPTAKAGGTAPGGAEPDLSLRSLAYNSRFLDLVRQHAQSAGGGSSITPLPPVGTSGDESARRPRSRASYIASKHAAVLSGGAVGTTSAASANGLANSLPRLQLFIRKIYDAKTLSDNNMRHDAAVAGAGSGSVEHPLPEFVLDLQRKKYGLASLVEHKTWQLIVAIAAHRDTNAEVDLFASFLEESRPKSELVLFLRTRAVVYGITIGVRFPGHISASYHHPVTNKQANAAGAGGDGAATSPSADEYICTDRAFAVISTVFPDAASANANSGGGPTIRQLLSSQVEQQSTNWTDLPHPPSLAQWTSMLGAASIHAMAGCIDPRCIKLSAFFELMLAQYRVIDLQLRHTKWARTVFNSVDRNNDGWIDFDSFLRLMSSAQPPHSQRELSHLFQHVLNQQQHGSTIVGSNTAGLTSAKQMSFRAWRMLSRQLLDSGVVFPAVTIRTAPPTKPESILRLISRHWAGFRPFFETWHQRLVASRDERDASCAVTAKHVRFLLERELSQAMTIPTATTATATTHATVTHTSIGAITTGTVSIGQPHGTAATGSGSGAAAAAAAANAAAAAGASRTITLYRGLLSLVMAHQSSHQLVAVGVDYPLRPLRVELELLERTALERDRILQEKLTGTTTAGSMGDRDSDDIMGGTAPATTAAAFNSTAGTGAASARASDDLKFDATASGPASARKSVSGRPPPPGITRKASTARGTATSVPTAMYEPVATAIPLPSYQS